MRSTAIAVRSALLVCAALAGCDRDAAEDQRTETITRDEIARARADWPAGVAEQVDSGNAAYRAHDYERASRYYRRAAELGPRISAAWFGIYMTEHARGTVAAADSAFQRTRELSPGASLLHAPPADTGRRRP
jgi:tetratricopeptide (TPR) repeat protein